MEATLRETTGAHSGASPKSSDSRCTLSIAKKWVKSGRVRGVPKRAESLIQRPASAVHAVNLRNALVDAAKESRCAIVALSVSPRVRQRC